MIPKIIHYCWFGKNPKSALLKKCIESWKKFCPDYEIKEWNEDNFDIASAPLYVRQAYENKKWGFVPDYIRLKIIHDNGGIYLDTDVELIKRPDELLNYKSFFAFEYTNYVALGLGFGAEKGCPILLELMQYYIDNPFVLENGKLNTVPAPRANNEVFLKHGLVRNGKTQVLDDGSIILSPAFMCPKNFSLDITHITKKTISIHHYDASWYTPEQKAKHKKDIRKARLSFVFVTMFRPFFKLMSLIIGKERAEKLKRKIFKS